LSAIDKGAGLGCIDLQFWTEDAEVSEPCPGHRGTQEEQRCRASEPLTQAPRLVWQKEFLSRMGRSKQLSAVLNGLAGAAPFEDSWNRHEQYLCIQSQGPLIDVLKVEADPVRK
jgi:hypothetical protein